MTVTSEVWVQGRSLKWDALHSAELYCAHRVKGATVKEEQFTGIVLGL